MLSRGSIAVAYLLLCHQECQLVLCLVIQLRELNTSDLSTDRLGDVGNLDALFQEGSKLGIRILACS